MEELTYKSKTSRFDSRKPKGDMAPNDCSELLDNFKMNTFKIDNFYKYVS